MTRSPMPHAASQPRIPFTKISATGNDFLIIDEGECALPARTGAALARRLCHRREGIGADGLIVLRHHPGGSAVTFYNADGSRPASCGNGLRGVAWYAVQRGLAPRRHTIVAPDGVHQVEVGRDQTRIDLQATPAGVRRLRLSAVTPAVAGYAVQVGVPHCVIPVEDITDLRWATDGPALRYGPPWGRRGCNIDVLQLDVHREGRIRTFERGVDAETLACGTGAVAAAVVALRLHRARLPLQLHAAGGDLVITRARGAGRYWVAGHVREVCTGTCPRGGASA